MKDLKVPGYVWVILLLALGVGIQAYAPQIEAATGLNTLVIGGIVSIIFLAAKAINPGTGELNKALDMIEQLLAANKARQTNATSPQVRGAADGPASVEPAIFEGDIPQRPNNAARILLG